MEGLRDPGGGGGFFPIGGGGPFMEADDMGRGAPGPVFLRLASDGMKADVLAEVGTSGRPPGILGAAAVGGLGAAIPGGFGVGRDDSGSEV